MKNYLNGVKKTVQKQNEWCVGKKKNPEDVQSSTLEYFNGPDNFFVVTFVIFLAVDSIVKGEIMVSIYNVYLPL